jgi:hypothetical protein
MLLFIREGDTKLSCADRIQLSLELNAHTAQNNHIKVGYSDKLNTVAWPYISHLIRELPPEEKNEWEKFEFLRAAFSTSLSTPTASNQSANFDDEVPGWCSDGSIMGFFQEASL